MNATSSLSRQLLIAMPALDDANFARSVTLICEHAGEGAMGLTLNRFADWRLGDLLRQLDLSLAADALEAEPVYSGGPVQNERGFVIHDAGPIYESTALIGDQLALTTSRDILADIAAGRGPRRFRLLLGYAGWGSGQLEYELGENAWIHAPLPSAEWLFATPAEQLWETALRSLGIDPLRLAQQAGHA